MATLAVTRARAILQALGIRVTAGSTTILVAWQACERGDAQTYGHNPISTTWATSDSTLLAGNSAGVRMYPTESEGIRATAKTLRNGDYPQIVAALRSGNVPMFLRARGEIARWGTGYGCLAGRLGGAPAQAPSGGITLPNIGKAVSRLPPWFGWVVVGVPVGAIVLDAIRRA